MTTMSWCDTARGSHFSFSFFSVWFVVLLLFWKSIYRTCCWCERSDDFLSCMLSLSGFCLLFTEAVPSCSEIAILSVLSVVCDMNGLYNPCSLSLLEGKLSYCTFQAHFDCIFIHRDSCLLMHSYFLI